MKITPLAQGSGTPADANIGSERMPADKIAAAKAIMLGQTPVRVAESDTPVDPQVARAERAIKRIKMRTQVSPDRFNPAGPIETSTEEPVAADAAPTENAIPDSNEQVPAVTEATQPLSPQFAALARQKRALQQERQAFEQEKAKLTPPNMDEYVSKADLLSNPLKVFEAGVTYDQLTEAILAGQSGSSEILELKKELKALKEGVDKNLNDRDTRAEEAALNEMCDEAEALSKEGNDYALIRENDAYDQVLTKIYSTYKKTGKVMDVRDAMKSVEDKLFDRAMKLTSIDKVRSKLQPASQAPEQQQPQNSQMRTLTNRDGTRAPLSRRERAILAATGQLRK